MKRFPILIVLFLWLGFVGAAKDLSIPQTAPTGTQQVEAGSLGPYVPTPQDVVERMLKLAELTKEDVVYDLGSGDGRIPITAAKLYGARGVGVEINQDLMAEAIANAKQAGVGELVTFRLEDAMETDISDATVVALYVLPLANLKLRPILTKQLTFGTRIVSHMYPMGDWEPDTIEIFQDVNGNTRTLYLWKVDGTYRPYSP